MFIQDVFIVLVSLVQIAQINVIVKPNFALNDVRCEIFKDKLYSCKRFIIS